MGEYFGQLNEIRLGARGQPAQKPDELAVYELWRTMGRPPLLEGAFMDQPYVAMLILYKVEQQVQLHEALFKAAMREAPNAP